MEPKQHRSVAKLMRLSNPKTLMINKLTINIPNVESNLLLSLRSPYRNVL